MRIKMKNKMKIKMKIKIKIKMGIKMGIKTGILGKIVFIHPILISQPEQILIQLNKKNNKQK